MVSKDIRKHLATYKFFALTHLLTDVLAVVNRMNLTLLKEDVDISSIQPVNITLASRFILLCFATWAKFTSLFYWDVQSFNGWSEKVGDKS